MKTIVTLKDGATDVYENAAPSISPDDRTFNIIDDKCNCLTDELPLNELTQIIFEP